MLHTGRHHAGRFALWRRVRATRLLSLPAITPCPAVNLCFQAVLYDGQVGRSRGKMKDAEDRQSSTDRRPSRARHRHTAPRDRHRAADDRPHRADRRPRHARDRPSSARDRPRRADERQRRAPDGRHRALRRRGCPENRHSMSSNGDGPPRGSRGRLGRGLPPPLGGCVGGSGGGPRRGVSTACQDPDARSRHHRSPAAKRFRPTVWHFNARYAPPPHPPSPERAQGPPRTANCLRPFGTLDSMVCIYLGLKSQALCLRRFASGWGASTPLPCLAEAFRGTGVRTGRRTGSTGGYRDDRSRVGLERQ